MNLLEKAVKPGGSPLLFHNAAAGRPHTVAVDGPFRVTQEIAACDQEITNAGRMWVRWRHVRPDAKKGDGAVCQIAESPEARGGDFRRAVRGMETLDWV